MPKTNYLENGLLNKMFRQTAFTVPDGYIGLLTVITDGEAGTVTEATYTGYARVAMTSSNFGTASTTGAITNTAIISFGTNSSTSQTAVGIGVWDAASAGNLIYYQALSPSVPIGNGETARFPIGNLTITEE